MERRVGTGEWEHLHRTAAGCPRCRAPLELRRAQISPPGWGALLITEWYTCAGCHRHFAYCPVGNRWMAAED